MSWLLEAGLRSWSLVVIIALSLGVMRVTSLQVQSCVWRIVLFASMAMPILQGLGQVAPDVTLGVSLSLPVSAIPRFQVEHLRPSVPFSVDRDPHLCFWLSSAYTVIASLFLARIAAGLVIGSRLCRRAERLVGAHGAARIRVSRDIESPAVFGSMILLPVSCASWSEATMSTVLAHEKSHLRHHDFFILLLASVHRAVFWFNPAAWWLLGRLALLAEMRSDDASIAAVGGPRHYAEILARIAASGRGVALSIPMASTDTVRQRLHRLERWRATPRLSGRKVWSTALLTTGSAVLLAALVGHPSAANIGHPFETADTIAQRRYEQARPRQVVPLDPEKLEHWVGSYRTSTFTALTISAADGNVYAQITGQERIEVFPDADGELFYRASPTQLTFTGRGTSPAPVAVLHQNGGEQALPRLTPDAAAALARRFAERLTDNRPQPGSTAALKRALSTGLNGAYLSPELAASMRSRQPTIQDELRQVGTLRSISFAGVGHGGWDVYDVHYQRAELRARILLGDDGRIDGLFLEYLP